MSLVKIVGKQFWPGDIIVQSFFIILEILSRSLAQSQKQERSHKQELEMNFNELSFMQPFLETRWDTLHDIVATWPRYFLHLFFTEADDSSRFSVNDADSSHRETFILEVEVSWEHSWWVREFEAGLQGRPAEEKYLRR